MQTSGVYVREKTFTFVPYFAAGLFATGAILAWTIHDHKRYNNTDPLTAIPAIYGDRPAPLACEYPWKRPPYWLMPILAICKRFANTLLFGDVAFKTDFTTWSSIPWGGRKVFKGLLALCLEVFKIGFLLLAVNTTHRMFASIVGYYHVDPWLTIVQCIPVTFALSSNVAALLAVATDMKMRNVLLARNLDDLAVAGTFGLDMETIAENQRKGAEMLSRGWSGYLLTVTTSLVPWPSSEEVFSGFMHKVYYGFIIASFGTMFILISLFNIFAGMWFGLCIAFNVLAYPFLAIWWVIKLLVLAIVFVLTLGFVRWPSLDITWPHLSWWLFYPTVYLVFAQLLGTGVAKLILKIKNNKKGIVDPDPEHAQWIDANKFKIDKYFEHNFASLVFQAAVFQLSICFLVRVFTGVEDPIMETYDTRGVSMYLDYVKAQFTGATETDRKSVV